jgi:predicted acetyltransferase
MSVEVRPMREEDREASVRIHAQAFNVGPHRLERQRRLALSEGFVITEGGVVRGGLRVNRVAQLFGGRAVSSAIVTAVKIAPEARGKGLAATLLREVIQALAGEGRALSTLFPSSPGLYRRVGYETAGATLRYRARPEWLVLPRGESLETWPADRRREMVECYGRFARRQAGLVDRDDGWWSERVFDPFLDRQPWTFGLERAGRLAGYLVCFDEPDPRAELPFASQRHCIDFIWEDGAAAAALLGFLGGQGPLVSAVTWPGPAHDPIGAIVAGAPLVATEFHPWMARLLDARSALGQRGYPETLAGSVTFRLTDDLLPANRAVLQVELAAGRAAVTPADRADLEIDIRGLAALFTGWSRPAELACLGLVRGGTAREVDFLAAAFAGPSPWMLDVV